MRLDQLLVAAKQASEQNRWHDAYGLAAQAANQNPENVHPWIILGIINFNLADPTAALEAILKALSIDENNFAALNWAGLISLSVGQLDSAAHFCKRAISLQPKDPEPYYNLGLTYARLGKLEESISPLRRAVKLHCRPTYLYALADVLAQMNRRLESIDHLKQATRMQPTEEGFVALMDAQIKTGRPDEALRTGEIAKRAFPQSAQVEIMIARGFEELGDYEQFEQHLEIAHRLAPRLAEYYTLKAKIAQRLGRFEEAEQLLKGAIVEAPELGHPYLSIVSARKIGPEDREFVAQMKRIASDPVVHPSQRAPILYALAKAHDNLEDYPSAINYYDSANAAQKRFALRSRTFDADRVKLEVDERIKQYRPPFFESLKPKASPSSLPIIVAGMMRSGTTLVEQILSSHHQVGGAGEQSFWASREDWYFDFVRSSLDLPAIAKAGFEYVELLQSRVQGFARVTDKNPANIMCLGLIHAANPNVKIIHTTRDPVDTALSIWFTPVDNPPSFCCDRENIVAMYREYLRLAEHWRQVLPPDRYLEVSYENLTARPEAETRRMLEFLDLEWDEKCLQPELNERLVSTPSLWQVRQPLYQTSVAKWRNYKPWIPEFLELHEIVG